MCRKTISQHPGLATSLQAIIGELRAKMIAREVERALTQCDAASFMPNGQRMHFVDVYSHRSFVFSHSLHTVSKPEQLPFKALVHFQDLVCGSGASVAILVGSQPTSICCLCNDLPCDQSYTNYAARGCLHIRSAPQSSHGFRAAKVGHAACLVHYKKRDKRTRI